jgi:ferredoxin
MARGIRRKDLREFLLQLAPRYRVVAPLEGMGGDVVMGDPAEGALSENVTRTHFSVKGVFFPREEAMFRFRNGEFFEEEKDKPAALFGLRPCETRGLQHLDRFFRQDFCDYYYHRNRGGSLVMTVACPTPPSRYCFCTSTGGGPIAESGFDLQLLPLDKDAYAVEAGSAAGEGLITSNFFYNLSADEETLAQKLRTEAPSKLSLSFPLEKIREALEKGHVPLEFWQRFGDICLYCGACTAVCPTCTCYDVADMTYDDSGIERKRSYDSCIFGGFTREASGHNPRKDEALRNKRRLEHKLVFDPRKYGYFTCTGCGKCSEFCLCGYSMVEALEGLSTLASM